MSDELAVAGLLLAIVGPWACGAVWLHLWLGFSGRYNLYVLLGHGYLLGILLVVALLQLWDAFAGTAFSYWSMVGIIAVLTLLGIVAHRGRQDAPPLQVHWEPVPRSHLVLIALLMSLIVLRHFTLLQILLLQPEFSTEAWMHWAAQPMAWFHEGTLHPSGEWAPADVPGEAAGAPPRAVPLVQLWAMLSIGAADHSFVFLPWIAVPVALGLAVFGHLRLAGVKTLHAAIASYALLSLPMFNEHTALTGYADIWLAAVFTLSICAVHQWRVTRHWAYGSLALLLVFACALIKNVGVLLGYVLVVSFVFGAFRANGWLRYVLLAVALLLVLAPAAWLFTSDAAGAGRLAQLALVDPPVLQGVGVDAGSPPGLGSMVLHGAQWHLLWYATAMLAVVAVLRGHGRQFLQAEWLCLAGGMLWLVVHFRISSQLPAGWVADTGGAALLVIAPGLVFCLGLLAARKKPNH